MRVQVIAPVLKLIFIKQRLDSYQRHARGACRNNLVKMNFIVCNAAFKP